MKIGVQEAPSPARDRFIPFLVRESYSEAMSIGRIPAFTIVLITELPLKPNNRKINNVTHQESGFFNEMNYKI